MSIDTNPYCADKIKNAIAKMDVNSLTNLLPDNLKYHDLEKSIFIERLRTAFNQFREMGDSHLIPIEGKCVGCYNSKIGYCFVGNNTGNYMQIVIREEYGILEDIRECGNFIKLNDDIELNEMICIDEQTILISLANTSRRNNLSD